jgi:hypothetical protein
LLVGTPLSQMSSVQGFPSSTGTQSAPPAPLLEEELLPPLPLLLDAELWPPAPLLLDAELSPPAPLLLDAELPPLAMGPGSLRQPPMATTIPTIPTFNQAPKRLFMGG